jgi:hypothetical protein
MNYDQERIDQAALALLYLNSWTEKGGHQRAWKSLDWDIGERLYEKGLIIGPVGKAKSLYLTEEGIELAKKIAEQLFQE